MANQFPIVKSACCFAHSIASMSPSTIRLFSATGSFWPSNLFKILAKKVAEFWRVRDDGTYQLWQESNIANTSLGTTGKKTQQKKYKTLVTTIPLAIQNDETVK